MNCVERCGKFDEGVLAMFDTWYRWWIRDLGEACKKVEDVRNFGRFEDIWRLRIRRETGRDLERWKLGLGDWESLRNVDNIDGRDVNQLEEKWHWRIKDLRRLEILEEHRREWRIEWHNSWWLRIMEEVWKLKNTVFVQWTWPRKQACARPRDARMLRGWRDAWRGIAMFITIKARKLGEKVEQLEVEGEIEVRWGMQSSVECWIGVEIFWKWWISEERCCPTLDFWNHWGLKWETVELGEVNNFLEFKCLGHMEQEEIWEEMSAVVANWTSERNVRMPPGVGVITLTE